MTAMEKQLSFNLLPFTFHPSFQDFQLEVGVCVAFTVIFPDKMLACNFWIYQFSSLPVDFWKQTFVICRGLIFFEDSS